GSGYFRAKQPWLRLSERFFTRITIKLLAAAIPFGYAVLEIPHEDRVACKINQLLLAQQIAFAFAQRSLDLLAVSNVDEGDNDTVDLVFNGAVRPHTEVVPVLVAATDLAPNRNEIGQNGARVLHKVGVFEPVRKIGDRAAFIGRCNAEQICDVFGKELDTQAGIEKQSAEIGRGHQVLQVAVSTRD